MKSDKQIDKKGQRKKKGKGQLEKKDTCPQHVGRGSENGMCPQLVPELVCPAGDWPSLHAALESGADAVYFGVKNFNMRAQAANFEPGQIKKIMTLIKKHRAKGYLAMNTLVKNEDVDKIDTILSSAQDAEVDAVILWDMSVLKIAREKGLRVHLSTQASVANIEAVRYYVRQGVKRIVLARECSLGDIRNIIRALDKEKIHCEIEAFVHGAMCVSISGRCFLSEYTFDRSANQGDCLQPCRREFHIQDTDGESAYILGTDYVLSPKDLCAIDFIEELIAAGIRAFKIEGRMRSPEYIRSASACYRKAIDAFYAGTLTPALKHTLKQELKAVYNRGFSSGFYFDTPGKKDMSRGLEHTHEKVFLGQVKKFYPRLSVADIRIQSGCLKKGDELLFIGEHTPGIRSHIEEIQKEHTFVDEASKGASVGVKLPFKVRPKDKVFLWKQKDLTV